MSEFECIYWEHKKCRPMDILANALGIPDALKVLPQYCEYCHETIKEHAIHIDVDGDLMSLTDTIKEMIETR